MEYSLLFQVCGMIAIPNVFLREVVEGSFVQRLGNVRGRQEMEMHIDPKARERRQSLGRQVQEFTELTQGQ